MKRTLIGLLLTLVFASAAGAQDFPDVSQYDPGNWFKPACPRCGMKAAIDWVQNVAIDADGTKKPVIAGWAFECESGRATDRVEAFAWDPALGVYMPVATELRWPNIPRGDVYADKVGACPRVSNESGFGAIITGAIPEGSTALMINVWRGPYKQTTKLLVLTR